MTNEEAINSVNNVLNSELLFDESIDYQVTSDDIEWLELVKETLEKAEKYKWHDLRKDPNDLPGDENPIIAKIKFYGKGSGMYKPNCYTSGVYRQYFKDWNLEQDHTFIDEYNPVVMYEVIKWKYIDDEEVEE